MKKQNLRDLPKFNDREFYPQGLPFADVKRLEETFDQLIGMEVSVDADAVEWLSRWRELDSLVDEESAIRHIESTLATDDPEVQKAFRYFNENVMPVVTVKYQDLKEKLLASRLLRQRIEAEAPVVLQKIETDKKLFRAENVPLQTEVQLLCAEYDQVSGAQSVEWQGKQITLTQLGREQEKLDRGVREAAWRAEWARRAVDADRLDALFDKMYALRQAQAKNAGFANYRDYVFLAKHRFDYGPAECMEFHEAIREAFVPTTRTLFKERKTRLGLSELRPWDQAVDMMGEAIIEPFNGVADLEQKIDSVFSRVDSELHGYYGTMRNHKLFDLANRKGKAPGGYQSFLAESRLPFIFMNSVGAQRDVFTLLHEAGHAFHSFLARHLDPFQISAPMEFCEVASMSMELMAMNELAKDFGADATKQLERSSLAAIPGLLLRIAMVDAFQHWIYTDPAGANAQARRAKWVELQKSYYPDINVSGLEAETGIAWHRILHIFQVPFYYVEYGIAQLGALQFWRRSDQDREDALTDYKRALSAGGTLGVKDLFRRANLEWPMQKSTCKTLANHLDGKLKAVLAAG